MNSENLYLAGIINENTEGQSKTYVTADSELKNLKIGEQILIRDVTGGRTSWKRMVVTKFIDKDHIEVSGIKTGNKYVFKTENCEIDIS